MDLTGGGEVRENSQALKRLDLCSDTVTQPTPGMRAAIAAAAVGDDVYGEDPTVRRLEERVAALLGKESALFVPSGTMGNQLGLLVHTRPGDEVIIGEGSHCAWYESGAGAAWAGVQFAVAGQGGPFTVADMLDAIKPPASRVTQAQARREAFEGGGGI
jgi:threonine aldolase